MHVMKSTTMCAACLAISCTIGSASAQDAQLYDKVADPNAAHVRAMAPDQSSAVIAGKLVDETTRGVTPYLVIEPGEIEISAGGRSGTLIAEAGGYFTLAWDADGRPLAFSDIPADDPSKAALYVYNLTDLPDLDVFVPAANRNAVEDVPASGGKSVMLKAPLKIALELFSGDELVAEIPMIEFERRGGVSVVLTGTGGDYSAYAVSNSSH